MQSQGLYLSAFLILIFSQLPLFAGAASTTLPKEPDAIVESKLVALKDRDYGAFLKGGSSEFRTAMTEERFRSVVAQLGDSLNNGYSLSRLGRIEKNGYDVFIYRLEYSGLDSDSVVRLVMDEEVIAGFWVQ